jgi:Kef-type K+ transport system membrane component KefB
MVLKSLTVSSLRAPDPDQDGQRRLRRLQLLRAPMLIVAFAVALGSAAVWAASGEHGGAGHVDPFAPVLLELAAIIVAAMIGRWAAAAVNQSPVLGELLIGVVVGNIGYWLGRPLFILVMHLGETQPLFAEIWTTGLPVREVAARVFSEAQLMPGGIGNEVVSILTGPGSSHLVTMTIALWMFSSLGVILLLFMVGLESTVHEMLAVGPRALWVGVIGIVAPLVLGFFATEAALPGIPTAVSLFMGATLSATSVGITARVFKDLNKLQTREAKIILGAAVIDDVLGLIILAIVVGIAASGGVQLGAVARIGLLSAIFLGGVIVLGEHMVRALIPAMRALDRRNLKLLFPLALASILSWLASKIELATIVGAFAAGLILNEEHFPKTDGEDGPTMEELIRPLEAMFAPLFFVLMGMQVNVATFGSMNTLGITLVLTVTAVGAKLIAGLPAGKDVDRLSVGIGMVPRGEVGLIFASVGKGLGVVDEGLFSAVVIMVIVTTLLAPLLLKWSLSRR